jgi:transposase, IS30 family
MGRSYEQVSLRERVEIEILRRSGVSMRQIGKVLGRSASTISRELARNARPTKQWSGAYQGERAQDLALRRRRWDARFKLARQPDLQSLVRDGLAMGRSPEQIAGRLALEHGRPVISHESIYRFIYHRSAQKDYWHRLLPRKKSRRGQLGKRGGSPASRMSRRRSLAGRPAEAGDRAVPGHWEADLMGFSKSGQYVLVTHERTSRLLRVERLPNKTAASVRKKLSDWLQTLPRPLRRTLTFDNGTEFALHYKLSCKLSHGTFFCDPHAPWQKGGIENAIGRMRRTLPRKSDLAAITHEQLQSLVAAYNDTPRKCLAFRTPSEVFSDIINRVALQT